MTPRIAAGPRFGAGAVTAGAVAVIVGCATAPATALASSEQSGPAPRCNLEPVERCGAGRLPRVEGKAWRDGEAKRLPEMARRGTVPVEWDGRSARLVDSCALDGHYTEVAGEAGSGRFWATNRVLFRADEIRADCAAATHLVAAFVARRTDGKVPPAGGGEPSAIASASAILVPLPCPSVSDSQPARGCIGRGLSGGERLERARGLVASARSGGGARPDMALALEVFALAPDDYLGTSYARRGDTEDCALAQQAVWIGSQYVLSRDREGRQQMQLAKPGGRPPVPSLDDRAGPPSSCLDRPVFLQCFPGLFDPAPASASCWYRPETLGAGGAGR